MDLCFAFRSRETGVVEKLLVSDVITVLMSVIMWHEQF